MWESRSASQCIVRAYHVSCVSPAVEKCCSFFCRGMLLLFVEKMLSPTRRVIMFAPACQAHVATHPNCRQINVAPTLVSDECCLFAGVQVSIQMSIPVYTYLCRCSQCWFWFMPRLSMLFPRANPDLPPSPVIILPCRTLHLKCLVSLRSSRRETRSDGYCSFCCGLLVLE